jgi:hypothetical protein
VTSNGKLSTFHFKAHPNQKFGFDDFEYEEWASDYHPFKSEGFYPIYSAHKSVSSKERDRVLLIYKGSKKGYKKNLVNCA